MNTDSDKLTLARAMGRVPSGLYILTVSNADNAQAMLASWVQQASFNPPCVSIALGCDRAVLQRLGEGAVLALSVVPADDKVMLRKFARGVDDASGFDGIATERTPSGQIVLVDAVAWLECCVRQRVEFGADHCLLIAEVCAGKLLRQTPPFTHVRGNGMKY